MRVAVTVAAALLLAQSASAEEIQKSAQADPRGEVVISNVAGEVRVTGWDRNEVHVSADLSDDNQRLEFRTSGARTTIEVMLPKGRSYHGSTDLVVQVPRNSSLTMTTVSADQTIKDVRGMQRLQAVSGMIQTELWNEDLELKNVSGEVSVRGHSGKGAMRVTTVSGGVRLDDVGPEMELNTVTGDMNVRVSELSKARIRTTNGNLELRAAKLTDDVRIDAEGINGDLRFRLPRTLDAEIDISTFNGEIDNCFGPEPHKTSEYGPGNALRFKEGNGDGRIRIKALNGTVEICNR
ncbi:MAG TPA: DUF4097 family beta strand repeat-containing protein [Steroidobacteraceae bacterium]|jgi:DUF4097 and DUF4098 domain-containing protein YvlB|nr:DUF4097 family beta strand repeat-containing protein [Steroidobacteraceae bacterium]